ncbi:MAG: hypothetical protein JSV04_06710 [Candidatus Heimdallarchaeota archaeon]|nr:MAG: hypothetical protein JSV04_06710 [Candidatus Heimdallarchaeota archaeon]
MPRPIKTRVCSETDKKNAEIFNHVDDLILTNRWNKALEDLQYLHRNGPPNLRPLVSKKLAWLYFEMKNYKKSLVFLQFLLPSYEVHINRMLILSLFYLDKKDQAVWHLARAPLQLSNKRELLYLIFPDLKKEFQRNPSGSQISVRCPNCTQFLFFIKDKMKCLFCDKNSLSGLVNL